MAGMETARAPTSLASVTGQLQMCVAGSCTQLHAAGMNGTTLV